MIKKYDLRVRVFFVLLVFGMGVDILYVINIIYILLLGIIEVYM